MMKLNVTQAIKNTQMMSNHKPKAIIHDIVRNHDDVWVSWVKEMNWIKKKGYIEYGRAQLSLVCTFSIVHVEIQSR